MTCRLHPVRPARQTVSGWTASTQPRCPRMRAKRIDDLFAQPTRYRHLDPLLTRLHRRKAELLKVLERPEIPPHTNAPENDLRAGISQHRIACGTMSADGRRAGDVMPGLMTTCRKLDISCFDWPGDRLGLRRSVQRTPSFRNASQLRPSDPECPEICPAYRAGPCPGFPCIRAGRCMALKFLLL